ncbi:hypothetical protein J2Z47_002816 [Cohnella thailandensis]|nr:hypothetical protein [Cohnella thailandensis]
MPHHLVKLSRREKAAIFAMIDVRVEKERKERKTRRT